MNDLLSRSFSGPHSYVDLKKDAFRDLEEGPMTEMADMSAEKNLAPFFEEVEDIKRDMDKVKQLLMKLQDANEESKTIHKAQAIKALRDRVDKDVEQVLKMAKSIKGKLEALDRANMANRRIVGFGEGSSADRTRTQITNTLRKKLKDLMGDFQLLRQKMVGEYRETIERRYYTVTGQYPDEQTIEQIIDTGESENFLHKAIQEQGRGQVIETIREIHERHDAVKEIEKNLLELHQIFLDMAVLVEAQGEQLNTIEEQVNRASSFVSRGRTQLETAKKHQRNTRKWMCYGIILLLILIIIIVVPVVTSLKKKK